MLHYLGSSVLLHLFTSSTPLYFMANLDLSKLQELLQNAEANQTLLQQVRKNLTQVEVLLGEISQMLEPGYTPPKKERQPKNAGTGKGPGRPKKNA